VGGPWAARSWVLAQTDVCLRPPPGKLREFGDPVWVSSNEVFYAGQQVFNDPDGAEHTVYVSYRLRKLGSDWYVVGVGSGTKPIESAYKDFRY